MKKLLFLLPLFLLADVNPFNAGNLDSNSPYGLTPDEKAILQNKKNISKLKDKISNLNSQLDKLTLTVSNINDLINQKLGALSTIIDELDNEKLQIKDLYDKYKQQNNQIEEINKKIASLEENITSIKESIKTITEIQNQNFNILRDSINKILLTIQKLNKPLSGKEAYKKAKIAFFSGDLNKAKKFFLYSLQKNYLPATSSFYLGEIYFKKGDYEKALAFYKKSVNLYPKKTSFTEKLLYHTGISFLKIGNKQGAKLTFQKLINDYPNSKYANLAKKELEKLK